MKIVTPCVCICSFQHVYSVCVLFYNLQLWYALAKTLSEQAAWALAMDRMLSMVSINAGLVLGPGVSQQNPSSTISYLKGKHVWHDIFIKKNRNKKRTCHCKILRWSSICFNFQSCNRGSSNVWKWGASLCRCELPGWCPYSSFPGPVHMWPILLLQSDGQLWGRSSQTCTELEPFNIITARVTVIKWWVFVDSKGWPIWAHSALW